jgi:hypothetical protein
MPRVTLPICQIVDEAHRTLATLSTRARIQCVTEGGGRIASYVAAFRTRGGGLMLTLSFR